MAPSSQWDKSQYQQNSKKSKLTCIIPAQVNTKQVMSVRGIPGVHLSVVGNMEVKGAIAKASSLSRELCRLALSAFHQLYTRELL
jgi:hypothetical protein